jgi:stage II sporulation protein AA (anti-sigma F factor antagonist)
MRDAAAGPLKISIEHPDGVAVVRVEGEVDLDNAENLAAALRTAGADGRRGVVADLLGVPFMDSSGLKALLVASADLGGRLRLALSPGSPVLRLLELVEVSDRFDIHNSPDEAVSSLESSR